MAIGCKNDKKRFTLLNSDKTKIDFENTITENDTLNILTTEFVYNGGGVALGDLNGDGLQDVFFTGNQVDNQLYLNKGNLTFENITEKAGVQKRLNEWSSGINLLDINCDGKLDIYVCNTMLTDPSRRKNALYVNQGNTTEGVPQFAEKAQEYGLADTSHASNAQFFDYDNDGDLDLFIAVNYMDTRYPNQYFQKVKDGSSPNTDRLYRNDWSDTAGHPVFTDVSRQAGILLEGYSHSSLITDFNHDGWQDIYVANDYVTNDLIYINQKNGTFKNEIAAIFKHQAASAMGSDVADINNDGRLDIFVTEMLPYHNKRKKLFINANNYTSYINNESFGFEYQFTRNVLQVNAGINPETGLPIFSDVAFWAGVQETEWSWTPLLADFDNDGLRDIFITNGFPRDVTDHDFGAFRGSVSNLMSPMDLQNQIPQIKVPKFIFKNEGNLTFKDYSKEWGVDMLAFTNGAACGDLDNDGDLDIVTNNINDKAFVFRNNLNDSKKISAHFLRIQLKGEAANPDAFGATVTAYFQGQKQTAQVLSARGYISSAEPIVHFGLGAMTQVDSVQVFWQGRGVVTIKTPPIDQTITVLYDATAVIHSSPIVSAQAQLYRDFNVVNSVFTIENPKALGLSYVHRDSDFIDFNFQKTLPHKFSQAGPYPSVGDADGDGLDDIFIGGSALNTGTWFFQTRDGRFIKKEVNYKTDTEMKEEALGTLLFDADGDGDNDLYIVHGGGQYAPESVFYQDVLCVNDGKGHFKIAANALPKETACGQVVKTADYDSDGDLDLFVGGRVLPRNYPKTDRSFILRNDSKGKDTPQFTDVTAQVCPDLAFVGLVTDAVWSDFDGDKKPDLLVAGEWMPLTFFKNNTTHFTNITSQTGISDRVGWWSSLAAADFDKDGDLDFIAGNYGQNTYFKCSSSEPLSIYAKDFDNNGSYDPFISCFWRDTAGQKQEYFYHTRDDMIKQLVLIRRKFQTYGAFGAATVAQVFNQEELKGALILKANFMSSSFIENIGKGIFKITPLPNEAQIAPIFGILPYDVNNDGLLDVLLVGNDYGMELMQGRADAFNGLVLINKGNKTFAPLSIEASHFVVPDDARALLKVRRNNGEDLIIATQNKGAMKVFSLK